MKKSIKVMDVPKIKRAGSDPRKRGDMAEQKIKLLEVSPFEMALLRFNPVRIVLSLLLNALKYVYYALKILRIYKELFRVRQIARRISQNFKFQHA